MGHGYSALAARVLSWRPGQPGRDLQTGTAMHDEERPALEQAPEEDLDLEGAETTVLSTPYGEATGVRRPPALNAPTPDAAAGDAPGREIGRASCRERV